MKKPFMKTPITRTTLAAVIAAMGFCFTAQASIFSVTNVNNRFFVSRSDASATETVYYRLVGLSAYPGKHFAAQNPQQQRHGQVLQGRNWDLNLLRTR